MQVATLIEVLREAVVNAIEGRMRGITFLTK